MTSDVCSNCGHGYEARCSRCYRSFGCGNMGGRCPQCGEGIIDHEVDREYAVWLAGFYKDFPHELKTATNLEVSRENTTYELKSEVGQ